MKKRYLTPALQVNETEPQNMMAVSLLGGDADPDAEVLSREDSEEWSIWDE